MAPITKESAPSLSASQERAPAQSAMPASQNAGAPAAPRKDAIGIEIPVVLYASRNSSAAKSLSKAPPPVREETRTVIVFPQGAVVRLCATISVGEMIVLTNQQTGADVLCRVAAVKTQPGIQNYVDLEFTQRAPGFWGGNSAADPSDRGERPASDPAPRTVATAPVFLTPAQQPSFSSVSAAESVVPVAAAMPISVPAVPATPLPPLAAEPLRPAAARPAVPITPPVTSPLSGVSTSLRAAKPVPSTLTGDRLDWTNQTPPSSRKGLWAAVAAVAVAGLLAGGFFLNRREQSASPTSGVTVAAPIAPMQPAALERAQQPLAPVAAESAPSAAAAPVPAPSWLPEAPKHEQPQAENIPQPAPAAQSSARRAAISVGKLSAPIPKKPITVSSSEPPPVLLTQNSTAADGILRTGELSGVSHAEAPTAFAAENSPAQPVLPARPAASGAQLESPKLIVSPNPLYPSAARAQSLEGVVALDALVDAAGNVAEVKAISGPMLLRQAAIDALRKWKYQPARLNGQPTSTHVQVNIAFKLH